jgi:hypothetical protein
MTAGSSIGFIKTDLIQGSMVNIHWTPLQKQRAGWTLNTED